MAKLIFNIHRDNINGGVLVSLQELTRIYLRDFLSAFMTDKEGILMNEWDAKKILDELSIDELREAMEKINPDLERLMMEQNK